MEEETRFKPKLGQGSNLANPKLYNGWTHSPTTKTTTRTTKRQSQPFSILPMRRASPSMANSTRARQRFTHMQTPLPHLQVHHRTPLLRRFQNLRESSNPNFQLRRWPTLPFLLLHSVSNPTFTIPATPVLGLRRVGLGGSTRRGTGQVGGRIGGECGRVWLREVRRWWRVQVSVFEVRRVGGFGEWVRTELWVWVGVWESVDSERGFGSVEDFEGQEERLVFVLWWVHSQRPIHLWVCR